MSPVKIESGSSSFITQDKERAGFRVSRTNLGIVCTGTEDGGRVVIARKINNEVDSKTHHNYDFEEPIEVHKGEEPVVKRYVLKKTNGEKEVISLKISAV